MQALVSRGRVAAYQQTHTHILLLCDEAQEGGAMKDAEIAQVLKVGLATVERVRRRDVEDGIGVQGAIAPPCEEVGWSR